jgi:hypothetical protein
VGDASFDLISSYFPQHHCSKSTILQTVAKVKERVLKLSTSITESQCFDFPSNCGRKEKLTQEQKDTIIRLTIQSQQHREKESWQAIADGDFENAGLPKISITLHQNVMYAAGYARCRPGWKPHLTPEQEQVRYKWALAHNPNQYEYGDGLGFDFCNIVFTDKTPAQIGEQRGMQRVWCKDGEQYNDGVKKDCTSKYSQLQFYSAFRYQHKGPCVVYCQGTDAEKKAADEALHQENKERKANWNSTQLTARAKLCNKCKKATTTADSARASFSICHCVTTISARRAREVVLMAIGIAKRHSKWSSHGCNNPKKRAFTANYYCLQKAGYTP